MEDVALNFRHGITYEDLDSALSRLERQETLRFLFALVKPNKQFVQDFRREHSLALIPSNGRNWQSVIPAEARKVGSPCRLVKTPTDGNGDLWWSPVVLDKWEKIAERLKYNVWKEQSERYPQIVGPWKLDQVSFIIGDPLCPIPAVVEDFFVAFIDHGCKHLPRRFRHLMQIQDLASLPPPLKTQREREREAKNARDLQWQQARERAEMERKAILSRMSSNERQEFLRNEKAEVTRQEQEKKAKEEKRRAEEEQHERSMEEHTRKHKHEMRMLDGIHDMNQATKRDLRAAKHAWEKRQGWR